MMKEKINNRTAIAIHGGCGVLSKQRMSEDHWSAVRYSLERSLRMGWEVLQLEGSALDAVQAAVVCLEDDPLFNAGYGAALNSDREHELDACIMDGSKVNFGGIIGARFIKNPVLGARAVLDEGGNVLLFGGGADRFARDAGLITVENSYFTTEKQLKAFETVRQHILSGRLNEISEADKHGTVGAVALDKRGDLAAATSTGGGNYKRPGRVGDTAIAGAGTYARNGVCAVSCTGRGEVFLRWSIAHELAARVEYLNFDLEMAANALIQGLLPNYCKAAGLIAVDSNGLIVTPFLGEGMYRGWITTEGEMNLAVYSEEQKMILVR